MKQLKFDFVYLTQEFIEYCRKVQIHRPTKRGSRWWLSDPTISDIFQQYDKKKS